MKAITITDVKLKFNTVAMKAKLRISEPEDIDEFDGMMKTATNIARPKIVFKEAYITDRHDDGVSINQKHFNCNLMKNNLADIHRVFPFVVTCGMELYEWAKSFDDVFVQYWADHIMEVTLRNAVGKLYAIVKNQYGITKISSMNPGSLDGWPIEQQAPLFELLDNRQVEIGVKLTESFLMIPQKTVSGILFKSKSGYTNCKLCERVNCPSRSAKYEPGLREKLTEA